MDTIALPSWIPSFNPILIRILTISCLALLATSIFPPTSAHSGDAFEAFTSTEPTIDGVINDDEWSAADQITFSIPEGQATIFVMNDARSLHMAAMVEDDSLDEIANVARDILTIDFDARHDGLTFEVGEDTISIGARTGIGDGFVGPDGSILNDGQLDAAGMVGRIGNFNHFEISHPFNSGDGNDIAAECGDTIGARFILFDDSGSDTRTITVFPAGLSAADPDQSGWADITAVCPPLPPPEIPVTLILIILIAIGWSAYAGYLVRKRRGARETRQPE